MINVLRFEPPTYILSRYAAGLLGICRKVSGVEKVLGTPPCAIIRRSWNELNAYRMERVRARLAGEDYDDTPDTPPVLFTLPEAAWKIGISIHAAMARLTKPDARLVCGGMRPDEL